MPLLNKKIKNYIFIKILYMNVHFIKKKRGGGGEGWKKKNLKAKTNGERQKRKEKINKNQRKVIEEDKRTKKREAMENVVHA